MNAERFLRTISNGPEVVLKENARPKTVDEGTVWNEFLQGKDGALAYIYRAYVGKLYNYGRQVVNNDETVSDCIQDVFYELIRSRKKLKQTSSIKNYLYASLRRRLVRLQKREGKIPKQQLDEGEGFFKISFVKDDSTPLDQFALEQVRLLEQACNALPVRQREALILLYYEELNYLEIADIMGIGKVRSARALVYRAIDSLKLAIQPFKAEFLN